VIIPAQTLTRGGGLIDGPRAGGVTTANSTTTKGGFMAYPSLAPEILEPNR